MVSESSLLKEYFQNVKHTRPTIIITRPTIIIIRPTTILKHITPLFKVLVIKVTI